MITFYTNSIKYLISKIKVKKGNFILKKFSDGEIYVRIKDNVKNKPVWVLASTIPPGDNLLELLFLLDALKREKAKISLLIAYFGYARQDKKEKGESLSAKVVCDSLKQVKKIKIIHMHSPLSKKFLHYENIIPLELYYPIIKKFDVIVAPDRGVLSLVKNISQKTKIPFVSMKKVRPTYEKAKITKMSGEVKDKKALIIDDMISTGGTIVAASNVLKQAGAKEISVLATHGLFTGETVKKIEKSPIKKIYVTNSLLPKHSIKIKIIDLSRILEKIIKHGNI